MSISVDVPCKINSIKGLSIRCSENVGKSVNIKLVLKKAFYTLRNFKLNAMFATNNQKTSMSVQNSKLFVVLIL